MADTVGTIASILQLVDTALQVREYIQDFRHAPQEQQKLLSEMNDLAPLLAELQSRITGSSSRRMLDQLKHPLHVFKLTMERFTEKLRPADGRLSRVSKQLTWAMWNKTESKEYLAKFEQFKTLLNAWLLLDISLRISVCITFHVLTVTCRDMDRRDHDSKWVSISSSTELILGLQQGILEAMAAAAKQQEHAQNRM